MNNPCRVFERVDVCVIKYCNHLFPEGGVDRPAIVVDVPHLLVIP